VTLDETFARNVLVDEKHPLRVFVQVEEDPRCAAVVVQGKSPAGFEVVGPDAACDVPFQWQVTCNRRDEILPNGNVSHYQDLRFEPAPPPLPENGAGGGP
jgi:hypothetical protein